MDKPIELEMSCVANLPIELQLSFAIVRNNGHFIVCADGPSCGDCLTCALAKTLMTSRNSEIMKPELITSKLRSKHIYFFLSVMSVVCGSCIVTQTNVLFPVICRSLSVGAEEDAHEFMRYLLENVEKGYLKRVPQKK